MRLVWVVLSPRSSFSVELNDSGREREAGIGGDYRVFCHIMDDGAFDPDDVGQGNFGDSFRLSSVVSLLDPGAGGESQVVVEDVWLFWRATSTNVTR